MPNPAVNITVRDGALGNVPPSPSNIVAVFGPSETGDANSPTLLGGQPGEVVTLFGYGPGPSLVAALVASGVQCVFTRVPTSAPGAADSVTKTGTGLSVMSVSGTPKDRYDALVVVTRSGTAGDDAGPAVTVSFDGGVSASREIRVPASRVISSFAPVTGLSLTFSAASMVAGDTYRFTTSAPTVAAADVADAVDAFRQSIQEAAIGYCVGQFDANDAAVIAGSVGQFEEAHRFVRFFVESEDLNGRTLQQWMSDLTSDFASFESARIAVPAGYCLALDPVTKFSLRRSVGFLAVVRAGLTQVGVDPSRVSDGALVPFAGAAATRTVYYDESLNPGLGNQRFYTLQSYRGRAGYYVAQGRLMSGPTSDFDLIQLGRVMDESCRVADVYFTGILGIGLRVSRKTGFILPKDRLAIETGSDQAQRVALVSTGQVSDIFTDVAANDVILTTKTLSVTVSIIPLGYVRTVDLTMTFYNPALQVQQAA